jgi:hypothetical protein
MIFVLSEVKEITCEVPSARGNEKTGLRNVAKKFWFGNAFGCLNLGYEGYGR